VAGGLRTVADIVDQFNDDLQVTDRARNAADKIDRGADSLDGLRTKVDDLKSAKGVELTRKLVTLAREAIAASAQLAEGLATARQVIAVVGDHSAEWREVLVSRTYLAATACTLVGLWGGLGQLCLIGWGRWRFALDRLEHGS
jgi:hypothetical protein